MNAPYTTPRHWYSSCPRCRQIIGAMMIGKWHLVWSMGEQQRRDAQPYFGSAVLNAQGFGPMPKNRRGGNHDCPQPEPETPR